MPILSDVLGTIREIRRLSVATLLAAMPLGAGARRDSKYYERIEADESTKKGSPRIPSADYLRAIAEAYEHLNMPLTLQEHMRLAAAYVGAVTAKALIDYDAAAKHLPTVMQKSASAKGSS